MPLKAANGLTYYDLTNTYGHNVPQWPSSPNLNFRVTKFHAKDGIYEIVKQLAREGVAIILISDEIPEVLYHTHRVLIMREGKIVGEVTGEAMTEAEIVIHATGANTNKSSNKRAAGA